MAIFLSDLPSPHRVCAVACVWARCCKLTLLLAQAGKLLMALWVNAHSQKAADRRQCIAGLGSHRVASRAHCIEVQASVSTAASKCRPQPSIEESSALQVKNPFLTCV
jgi:hypothetical protein